MLEQKLKDYGKLDIYPFHMPGHKRIPLDEGSPYAIDITEIEGFDNLHEAREILRQEQERAAKIYGAKESFYLVNGSTCGILAAISACVRRGGTILASRNSHKSVYNGIFLRELDVVYAYPEITDFGLQGQIRPETVEKILRENSQIEAVLITCPTYDGIMSDIKSIAEVAHKHRIPLIVDGAHGAHLGFSKDFPENPVALGADVVIESVHKTLPAFTQTALLHLCGDLVSAEKIKKYLSIYETSSPSYILMAGISRCMSFLQEDASEKFQCLSENLDKFYGRTRNLKNIKILEKVDFKESDAFDFDKSKILIFSRKAEVSGNDLYEVLLEKYHLQMEMVSGQYVLALCSVMDTKVSFERLAVALEEIDESDLFAETKVARLENCSIYHELKQVLPIHKTEDLEKLEVDFKDAIGKINGEYVYLYPPGIPLIVPGEEITSEVIQTILDCQSKGLKVEGLSGKSGIFIVNFS